MQQTWEVWRRRWLNYKTKFSTSGNYFVPIPQEHTDDEHIQESHNDDSNNEGPQAPTQHQSLFQQFMLHACSRTVPRQVLRTCPIGDNTKYSKANLLNTKQLMGLTFFAMTGVSFAI